MSPSQCRAGSLRVPRLEQASRRHARDCCLGRARRRWRTNCRRTRRIQGREQARHQHERGCDAARGSTSAYVAGPESRPRGRSSGEVCGTAWPRLSISRLSADLFRQVTAGVGQVDALPFASNGRILSTPPETFQVLTVGLHAYCLPFPVGN
jgi:hypothetical protein